MQHTPRDQLSIGQINLRASIQALDSLMHSPLLPSLDIIAISDPPLKFRKHQAAGTGNFRWIGAKNTESWAGFLIARNIQFSLLAAPQSFITGINVRTGSGSLALFSFYLKPAEKDAALNQLKAALELARLQFPKHMALGDSNGHSPLWSPLPDSNPIGEELEELTVQLGLSVVNDSESPPRRSMTHEEKATGSTSASHRDRPPT